jgi:hypothetical protein
MNDSESSMGKNSAVLSVCDYDLRMTMIRIIGKAAWHSAEEMEAEAIC